jgi:uncharacterized protein
MSNSSKAISALLLGTALLASQPMLAQDSRKLQQFVYVLRVTPPFQDASKWTPKENDAVARHFARLSQATDAKRVIFAGKTSEPLSQTFGLVVFEAENEEAARQFMSTDPAIQVGVMSATLHPYVLALQRRP